MHHFGIVAPGDGLFAFALVVTIPHVKPVQHPKDRHGDRFKGVWGLGKLIRGQRVDLFCHDGDDPALHVFDFILIAQWQTLGGIELELMFRIRIAVNFQNNIDQVQEVLFWILDGFSRFHFMQKPIQMLFYNAEQQRFFGAIIVINERLGDIAVICQIADRGRVISFGGKKGGGIF